MSSFLFPACETYSCISEHDKAAEDSSVEQERFPFSISRMGYKSEQQFGLSKEFEVKSFK